MRILFLSRWFPYPADNGSKIRILNLIKSLSTQHKIHLVSFMGEEACDCDRSALFAYCQKIDTVPYKKRWPLLTTSSGFFSETPKSLIESNNTAMHEIIKESTRKNNFDLVIASQLEMAYYAVSIPNIPKIFEELELSILYENYVRAIDPLKKIRNLLTWWKFSSFITSLLQDFIGCTVVSAKERDLLLNFLRNYQKIEILPNGLNLSIYNGDFGEPKPNTLIYSGSLTYSANFDAVQFFLKKVFPLILAENPEVKLSVTGGLNGVPLERLPNMNGVRFTGYLDDIRPTVRQSWINIVPLRIGGGTRVKILESLALGTPVVSTSKGAEGLDLVSGRDILIADNPADLAESILRLLQSPDLHKILGVNGLKAVANNNDWAVIAMQYEKFIGKCISQSFRTASS